MVVCRSIGTASELLETVGFQKIHKSLKVAWVRSAVNKDREDLGDKEIQIFDLPGVAMGHPTNDVLIIAVGQDGVQLGRQVSRRFTVR